MISKLSRPVNSLSATDSVGTSVSVNMKVSTVRPSAIDTGMPVSISASSRANMITARMPCGSTMRPRGVRDTDRHDQKRRQDEDEAERAAFAVALLAPARCRPDAGSSASMPSTWAASWCGSCAGPVEPPGHLQEAEAHQAGAERQRQVDDPHRHFEIVRLLPVWKICQTNEPPNTATMPVNSAPHSRPNTITRLRDAAAQHVDEDVDADMDAGAHAIGGAELGHPDEHVDAQLLRPGQVQGREPR